MGTAAMSGEMGWTWRLSRAERMELTWALAWPPAPFDLAYGVFRLLHVISEAQLQVLDFVWAAPSFFVFSTWAVRRAVRLEFPGFHLMVLRYGVG